MFLEYDWTYSVYRPRFGDVFISVDGYRSFADMREAVEVLRGRGLRVGKKTASRSWKIELLEGE